MNTRLSDIDPYSVLDIQHDGSPAEIEKAHRQKLIEAQYSVNLSVDHIEVAYQILIDPDQRRKFDKRLNDDALAKEYFSEDFHDNVKVVPKAKKRTRQRRKELLAAVLVVVFAFTLYIFVLRQRHDICPQCHHKSVVVVEKNKTGSRVTLSCTRASCGFSIEYDQAEDLANGPDED